MTLSLVTLLRARVVRLTCAAMVLLLASRSAQAQRPDTAAARRAATAARADSARPPLSPRRAFVYSFLIPGSAQSILGRNRAAALFLLFEGVSISMIRESNADVQEARRTANDSIVVSYDPGTGQPTRIAPRFDSDYIRARRSHLEDWIAVTIANHIFAGADAFVAAHLWDVPTQVSVRSTPRGTVVGASLAF